MTTSTTVAIILAFLLGVTTTVIIRFYYLSGSLRKKNRALIGRYAAADQDCHAGYRVCRILDLNHEHYGRWAVCRSSIQNDRLHESYIKVFTDDDDAFNFIEARELADKINS